MTLMGLDIGTTGCKAQIINPDGVRLGFAFREYSVDTDQQGKAEQDAEAVWLAAIDVMGRAVAEARLSGTDQEVGALSLSVQGDALVPTDASGNTIRPAILGMDYRSTPQTEKCAKLIGNRRLFDITGMRPHPMNTLTKILLFRDIDPKGFERTARMTTYADFILGKLGAPGVTDLTMASRTMAWDLNNGIWSEEILGYVGLDSNLFSQAVPSGTAVGHLSKSVADKIGLNTDVILATGGHDQTCAALGCGVTGTGRAVASTGTAEVLSCAFPKATNRNALYEGFYPEYEYTLPNLRFTFSLNHIGGILLKWFRDEFCFAELNKEVETGVNAYRILDDSMPKHPTKLFVLPHFNGSGTPWCDVNSRGAIVGLTMDTHRSDVAKAILESLTFELALNLETMEESGLKVNEITVAGGGASSQIWRQLKADILNRPVDIPKNPEAAGFGAAILAGGAAGLWDNAEAARKLYRSTTTIAPNPEKVKIYRDRMGIYRMLYPTLKEVNTRIAHE